MKILVLLGLLVVVQARAADWRELYCNGYNSQPSENPKMPYTLWEIHIDPERNKAELSVWSKVVETHTIKDIKPIFIDNPNYHVMRIIYTLDNEEKMITQFYRDKQSDDGYRKYGYGHLQNLNLDAPDFYCRRANGE